MISSILNEYQLRIIYRFICKIYNLAVTILKIFYKKSQEILTSLIKDISVKVAKSRIK